MINKSIKCDFMFLVKYAVAVMMVIGLITSCKKAEDKIVTSKAEDIATTDVRFPAEFEPQESVWMGWAIFDYKKGWSIHDLHVQIWAALAPSVYIDVAVNPDDKERGFSYDDQIKEIKALMVKYNVPENKVRFHKIFHEDVWWRDMGPIYVVNKTNQLEIADFSFNGWGYEANKSDYSISEGKIDQKVGEELGLKINSSKMISEGGNREFNGKGTMIAVEVVEKNRNPKMSKTQMEAEYKRLLGVTNVIWLPYGRFDDDLTFKSKLPNEKGVKEIYTVITTGGHIDEHTRFVSPTKVMYTSISEEEAKEDPIAAENKRRMDANLKVLKNAKDQDGNKFELIAMPSAPGIYETLKPGDGTYDYLAVNDSMKIHNPIAKDKPIKVILASSYLNFLISNKVVVTQKFWKPGCPESWKALDKRAFDIFQKTFPDRKIVAIDPRAINVGGGGIHCNTQQKPLIAK
jgi:agmatine deiminase